MKKIDTTHATFEHKRGTSSIATTGGWVRGVYVNAIEYTTTDKSVRGVAFLFGGLFGGGIALWGASLGVDAIAVSSHWSTSLIAIAGVAVFAPLGLGMLIWYSRKEFFRPLDLPILFDRKHRQVIWMDRWPPGGLLGMFKPWPVRISRCDWDRIVPEHHVVTYTTGSTARQQHTLALMVPHESAQAAAESITPYADGLLLGEPMTLTEQTVPAVWEHVRRYMNAKGPALPPGERVCDSTRPLGWWQSFGAVSMFGPGYVQRWHETPYMMGFMHLIAPLMLPLGLAMATANWLSYLTAYDVPWPQDVLDQVGSRVDGGAGSDGPTDEGART
ncbi:DUF6708 domain-containing protein [Limnohabitans sp. DM1]|uniref:DUF6708 domain-containing protein n=1 Tax=Limnohabitans sp. DM1 TaxID=1597955 RepID=UPI000B23F0CD|nr:DUF6708 domain-containing protein [Limnohabitans sp. DM1]